ncbi:MAG: 6-pyruvoyl tetrahydropterin synthase family protein [Vicinamibacterales bacterium]
MSFTIAKRFRFEAAHSLPSLPEGHKCRRVHGHSYSVWLELSGEVDEHGFVRDYGELGTAADLIIRALDHRDLNEFIDPSSAEVLARWLYVQFQPICPELVAVRVSETETTWAEYRP